MTKVVLFYIILNYRNRGGFVEILLKLNLYNPLVITGIVLLIAINFASLYLLVSEYVISTIPKKTGDMQIVHQTPDVITIRVKSLRREYDIFAVSDGLRVVEIK